MENLQPRVNEDPSLENFGLGTGEKKIVEQSFIAAEEDTKTENHASPTTTDARYPNKKRPRDHSQMGDPEDPPNAPPQMDEPTEEDEEVEAAKFPKLSSTEEGAEETKEQGAAVPHHHPKSKRRKIAILVAYCGVGYQGMQRNPGAKTIEGDLEEALFKARAISEDQYGNPRMVDWMRSARTDKGVSAVGQVVSGRFFIEPPGLVERVNSHLPEQIRVLGFKRVTPSFSAKKFCDRRRYEYVLPVFALDPSAHRDRESVLASEGKEGALVKCIECSERGRKVVGVMGRKNENSSRGDEGDGSNAELNETILGNHNEMAAGKVNNNEINEETLENHDVMVVEEKTLEKCDGIVMASVNYGESNERTLKNPDGIVMEAVNDHEFNEKSKHPSEMKSSGDLGSRENEPFLETGDGVHVAESPNEGSKSLKTVLPICGSGQAVFLKGPELGKVSAGQIDGPAVKSSFRYGEEERHQFNSILRQYVGTHNFHNLTTRTKAEDPSAYRYILSFEASDVFTIDGMDFVRCTVVGQSFMLHQIRKMMGLAVAVMRGCAPESIIATALRKDVHMNVPTAPELGLFLDECFFPAYNQKWQATHEEVSLKGFEQHILEFKQKYIYKHIASTEVKEGVLALWLHSLNQRNYPDFIAAKEAEEFQRGTESIVPGPKESTANTEVLAN